MTVRTPAPLCALLLPHAYAAPGNDGESAGKSADAPHASAAGEGAVGDMILQAVSLMGIAYRFGGNTPVNGFDCSGFIRYVFQSSGVNLPRSAAEQAQVGRPVSRDELKPRRRAVLQHPWLQLLAQRAVSGQWPLYPRPRTGKNIEITSLNASYWSSRFNGARRMVRARAGGWWRMVTDDVKRAKAWAASASAKKPAPWPMPALPPAWQALAPCRRCPAASPRVHATPAQQRRRGENPHAIGRLQTSAQRQNRQVQNRKTSHRQAEKSAKAAGKGKYTLSKGRIRQEHQKGKRGATRAEAKSSAKTTTNTAPPPAARTKAKGKAAAVKPTNKKNDER